MVTMGQAGSPEAFSSARGRGITAALVAEVIMVGEGTTGGPATDMAVDTAAVPLMADTVTLDADQAPVAIAVETAIAVEAVVDIAAVEAAVTAVAGADTAADTDTSAN
jgi:hypothetical protein